MTTENKDSRRSLTDEVAAATKDEKKLATPDPSASSGMGGDWMSKIGEAFRKIFAAISDGFKNFSFAGLLGAGSAQAAVPPSAPPQPTTVQAPQPAPAPGVQPQLGPKLTVSGAELSTQQKAFEGTLNPNQQKLYEDYQRKKDPFPSHDANGEAITYGVSNEMVIRKLNAESQAKSAFENSLSPDQKDRFKYLEQLQAEAKQRGPGIGPPILSGVKTPFPDEHPGAAAGKARLQERVTPPDPALGDRGVARVDLVAEPEAAPAAAAPPPAAAAPAGRPTRQNAFATQPRSYTEAGPNGSTTTVVIDDSPRSAGVGRNMPQQQFPDYSHGRMPGYGGTPGYGMPGRPVYSGGVDVSEQAIKARLMDALAGNVIGRTGSPLARIAVAGAMGVLSNEVMSQPSPRTVTLSPDGQMGAIPQVRRDFYGSAGPNEYGLNQRSVQILENTSAAVQTQLAQNLIGGRESPLVGFLNKLGR